jgi:hypothetical protein
MNRSNDQHESLRRAAPPLRAQAPQIDFISILAQMHPLTKLEIARLMLVAHIVSTGEHQCVLEDSDYVVTVARRG